MPALFVVFMRVRVVVIVICIPRALFINGT